MLVVGLRQAAPRTRSRLSLLLAGAACCWRSWVSWGSSSRGRPQAASGSVRRCTGTSSRRCLERGSGPSGSCRPGWGWPRGAARRWSPHSRIDGRRARSCGGAAADAGALGARERVREDRVRHRRRPCHRRSGLGRRPRRTRARALWAGRDRWPFAADAVPRFSGLAVVAVSWLIASGTVSGYLQVRALRGLWETTYGQLLLLKLALVLPLLLLGLYNNRRAVPRLRDDCYRGGATRASSASRRAELALMVAIVSVTAVLVSEPPARAEVAPRGPYATTRAARRPRAQPRRRPGHGRAEPDPPLPDQLLGPPAYVDEATVSATLASRQIGPIRMEAQRACSGHFIIHGAQLALAGRLAAARRDPPR